MSSELARAVLAAYKRGEISESDALKRLRVRPFAELGYAKVDLRRVERQGVPEVVFGEGKTPEQVVGIASALRQAGLPVLVTRVGSKTADVFQSVFPASRYYEEARCVTLTDGAQRRRMGFIVVASGGTSDIHVAEEAAVTAEFLGNVVKRVYDVGVACLGRVLDGLEVLRAANVVIVAAGMEGALPSVIAGLVDKPVIAVPTSVGYGANFGGVAALLGMLNSCGSGVVVVNIDNGFGAAFAAHQISRLADSDAAHPDKLDESELNK